MRREGVFVDQLAPVGDRIISPPVVVTGVRIDCTPLRSELVDQRLVILPEWLEYGWTATRPELTIEGRVCSWNTWERYYKTGDGIFSQQCLVTVAGPPGMPATRQTREDAVLEILAG